MTTFAALLRATHLAPSLVVTAISAVLAVGAGRGPEGTVAVAAAVLAGQFSVGWANDWVDRHRDAAVGRDDKPIPGGLLPAPTVLAAALAALVACAGLSLLSGPLAASAHLAAVGLGWAYDLGLKASAASVVPYAGAFGLLPVFVTAGLPGAPLPPWWAVTAGALLGAGAHFVNALPDLAADALVGVRGLPHRLGHGWSLLAGATLLAAGAAVALVGPGLDRATAAGLVAVAVLGAGVIVAARRGRERVAWQLALALAAAAIAALAAGGVSLA